MLQRQPHLPQPISLTSTAILTHHKQFSPPDVHFENQDTLGQQTVENIRT